MKEHRKIRLERNLDTLLGRQATDNEKINARGDIGLIVKGLEEEVDELQEAVDNIKNHLRI